MDSKERRSSDAPLKLKVDPFMLGGLRPLRHPWPDQNPADAFNEAHASARTPSRASGFVHWRIRAEVVAFGDTIFGAHCWLWAAAMGTPNNQSRRTIAAKLLLEFQYGGSFS
jgi:hypothetical protein